MRKDVFCLCFWLSEAATLLKCACKWLADVLGKDFTSPERNGISFKKSYTGQNTPLRHLQCMPQGLKSCMKCNVNVELHMVTDGLSFLYAPVQLVERVVDFFTNLWFELSFSCCPILSMTFEVSAQSFLPSSHNEAITFGNLSILK